MVDSNAHHLKATPDVFKAYAPHKHGISGSKMWAKLIQYCTALEREMHKSWRSA